MTLVFELVVNHYDKPFVENEDGQNMPWLLKHAVQVKDIEAPEGWEFMYGPLGWHFVHHVMPRIQRRFQGIAHKGLMKICRKYDIKVDRKPFLECVADTFHHFKDTSESQIVTGPRKGKKPLYGIHPLFVFVVTVSFPLTAILFGVYAVS